MQTNNKGLIITVGAILIAAFYMPWIKFFVSVSAWDMLFGDAGKALDTAFKYFALLIPIAGALIIYSAAFNNEDYPVPKQLLFSIPIITLIVIAVVIAAKISDNGGGNFRSSDFETLIKIFGIGFWLTLISSIILPFFGQENSKAVTLTKNQSISTNQKDKESTGNTSQSHIQQTYVRPQVNINLPKIDWNKTSANIASFLSKYKIVLSASAIIVIACVMVYNFFIKADPVKDGKSLAKEYCTCTEELNKNNSATMQIFVDEFDAKKYKSKLDARNALNNVLIPNQTRYTSCTGKVDSKYKEKYVDYNAKGGRNISIFEQTYNSLIGACNMDNNNVLSIKNNINEKIKTIIDPEPDTEKMKSDLLGREMIGWRFSYLGEFSNVSITNKTQSGERIEYNLTLNLIDQTTKDKHEAQVYLVYLKNDDGWYLSDLIEKYITYDYLIPSDRKISITIPSNSNWTAENLHNLKWTTIDSDWGTVWESGPQKPHLSLPSLNGFFLQSEEGHPVNVRFTFSPLN